MFGNRNILFLQEKETRSDIDIWNLRNVHLDALDYDLPKINMFLGIFEIDSTTT